MKNRNDLDITTTAAPDDYVTIFMATEMSGKSWLLGIHTPLENKISQHKFDAHDAAGLIGKVLRIKLDVENKLDKQVKIMSVYEAGYDGFWYHRMLTDAGIDNMVINPASLKVDRRARRAKTDGIDVNGMTRSLMAFARGESQVFSIVPVPSIEEEDLRRVGRERKRLVKERTQHSNRIKALLATQGVYGFKPLRGDCYDQLAAVELPGHLRAENERELQRLELVKKQIKQVESERDDVLSDEAQHKEAAQKILLLARLKGIGPEFSNLLATELYNRQFDNRRKLAGFVGLCSSPYNSGPMERDQGISKAGPPRIRQAAIELAWLWVRYQPDSKLTKWFKFRVGEMKGRIRRINIVALARKLLIALWRYVETGLVPEGAILK